MNDPAAPSLPASQKSAFKPISFWRLASKELRETLRDRRTLLTLFLMPLIVYPILSLLFQGFIASGFDQTQTVGGSTQKNEQDQYVFLFESDEAFQQIAEFLRPGFEVLRRESAQQNSQSPDQESTELGSVYDNGLTRHNYNVVDATRRLTLRQHISLGEADVGVALSRPKAENGQPGRPQFTLFYIRDDLRSLEAVRFLEQVLDSFKLGATLGVLRSRGIPMASPIGVDSLSVAPSASQQAGISLAALIPLILTLMTITGAVYPAIDLTAGERERGTLESMIAAPIPRLRILVGKLIAIVAVAMLTAVVNLIGMSITLWVFQFDRTLFGEQGLTWITMGRILGLLMLFAVFFSSVLLVITSFARSFKEGQAYLIPLMMVALAPSLMSLKPDLELSGLWTVTPLVNIVLLARDVLSGTASWSNAVVTIGTTVLYSVLALTMAARFFGTAKVLYGQDQGIGSLLKRPQLPRDFASASLSMFCLALLFPASFLWQGVMARTVVGAGLKSEAQDSASEMLANGLVERQLWLAALGLTLVFLVIPWLIAGFHRIRFLSGFGLNATSLLAILAGVLMGIGFGPLLLQAIAWSAQVMQQLGVSNESVSETLIQQGEEYVARLKQAPLWLILLAMAIVPAICEELFFRGLLFQSFRANLSPAKTILATGILFGFFHLISASGLTISRFLPTTVMGILLGWVCYRSGSVIPGMLMHGIHNAITVSFAYFRDDLVAADWITPEQSHVPLLAIIVGLVCAGLGIGLLWFLQPPAWREIRRPNSTANHAASDLESPASPA